MRNIVVFLFVFSQLGFAAEDCQLQFNIVDGNPDQFVDGVIYAVPGDVISLTGLLTVGANASCAADFSQWSTEFSQLIPVSAVCPPSSCGENQILDVDSCLCKCESGWNGTACRMCQEDDLCFPSFPFIEFGAKAADDIFDDEVAEIVCERDLSPSGFTFNKTLQCKLDTLSLLSGIPNVYLSSRCDLLAGTCKTAISEFQSTISGANEIDPDSGSSLLPIYCEASGCVFEGSSSTCSENYCYGGIAGTGSTAKNTKSSCNDATGTCSFESEGQILEAECFAGDCTAGYQVYFFVSPTAENELSFAGLVSLLCFSGLTPIFVSICLSRRYDVMAPTIDELNSEVNSDRSHVLAVIRDSNKNKEASDSTDVDGTVEMKPLKHRDVNERLKEPTEYLETAIRNSLRLSSSHHKNLSKVVSDEPPKIADVADDLRHSFRFERLCSKVIENGKTILDNVSGEALSGQLFGILGASGSGKSTLLSIISGLPIPGIGVTGDLTIDGHACGAWIRNLYSFVPQDDVLLPSITIRETLLFSALLRLPQGLPLEDKLLLVEATIAELGLQEIKDVIVGDPLSQLSKGISGGERRRLSIGIEVVKRPKILILDEPTSGLDIFNAESLIDTLSMLASRGRIIIFSLHQPSSRIYSTINRLMLLSQGKCLYSGETNEIVPFLKYCNLTCPATYNMADFLIHVAADTNAASNMFSRYQEGRSEWMGEAEEAKNLSFNEVDRSIKDSWVEESDLLSHNHVSWMDEFVLLSKRNFLDMMRSKSLLLSHVAIAVVSGIMVGVIFRNLDENLTGLQNRLGLLFFCLLVFTFTSFGVLELFISHRLIYNRESMHGYYSVTSYFIANLMFDLLFLRFIPVALFSSIVYPLTGLYRTNENLIIFFLACLMINIIAGSLCFLISTVSSSSLSTANLIASFIVLFSMLFAGYFVNMKTVLGVGNLEYLSFMWYGYEILVSNELENVVFKIVVKELDTVVQLPGTYILDSFGFKSNNTAMNFLVMTALSLFFMLMSLHVLNRQKDKWLNAKQGSNMLIDCFGLKCCKMTQKRPEHASDYDDKEVTLTVIPEFASLSGKDSTAVQQVSSRVSL